MLDRLVSRAILTNADGIRRHDEDGTGLGERGDAHGATHVIGEDEEGRAVRDDTRGVELHAIGDGAHTVLADAEANVALSRGVLLEVTNCFINVMLDGARSAEPPMKPGMAPPRALSMVWEWMRVATPLSSGVKVGRDFSQPAGNLPVMMDSNSAASSGYLDL